MRLLLCPNYHAQLAILYAALGSAALVARFARWHPKTFMIKLLSFILFAGSFLRVLYFR